MGHSIDLNKYDIRTDLILESIDIKKNSDDIKVNEEIIDKVKITTIEILNDNFSKKKGNYITIEFDDITDSDNFKKVEKVLVNYLKNILKKNNIDPKMSCLVVGLGNEKSTPDALGPLSVENVIVTNHLYELGELSQNFRRVFAISPGVMGQTGIETFDIINSIVNRIKPDFIVVIDSLAASSISRVNKTVQITDTGIHPGSGIGNKRSEISKETLNIPVIAVGVPTVVDAVTIVSDTIEYLQKQLSFHKNNINNKKMKMIPSSNINYENAENELNSEEKKEILGMVGNLTDEEIKKLIYEVLTPVNYNLIVTPKEIDFVLEKLSVLIGISLNKSLHDI